MSEYLKYYVNDINKKTEYNFCSEPRSNWIECCLNIVKILKIWKRVRTCFRNLVFFFNIRFHSTWHDGIENKVICQSYVPNSRGLFKASIILSSMVCIYIILRNYVYFIVSILISRDGNFDFYEFCFVRFSTSDQKTLQN